jgi:hypothetical protein
VCTLIVASRVWPEVPLLVAANRDEMSGRPSSPPVVSEHGGMGVLAPRDERAGGTWIGLNGAGVFVGVTNRQGASLDPGRRSRGLLVQDALACSSVSAAAEGAARWSPETHNGFHLVIGGAEEAELVWGDGLKVRRIALRPGVHVVTERSFGAAPSGREERLSQLAKELEIGPPPNDERLKEILSEHAEDAFDGICVHLPVIGYGTRSSTMLRLGERVRFLHTEGAPCSSELQDLSETARALLA